jgi:hypothetical protein
MTKSDKLLIGLVLALAIFSYLIYFMLYQGDSSLTAKIMVDGSIFTEIDLHHPIPNHCINIPGPLGTSIAEVKPGAIRMRSSPCSDHYCMETGWINRPGAVIVCVPNRIVIEITPDKNSIDTIAR